jgi:hypothetical protein
MEMLRSLRFALILDAIHRLLTSSLDTDNLSESSDMSTDSASSQDTFAVPEDDIQSFVASFLHKSRNEVYDTPLLST